MWSHYGDNHRGICLEFDTSVRLFGSARKVQYCRDYPALTVHVLDPESVFKTILTKSDVWSYEDEFRIVGVENAGGLPIQLDGEYLPLENALTGIILGCEADQARVLKFFKGHSPDLPLSLAVREQNKYRLTILPMAANHGARS